MPDQTSLPNSGAVSNLLIEELGLSDLPQEKQEQLLIRMTEVVLKRIFVETMEKLSKSDQETYSKMIEDSATPEEIEKFLNEKISGYDALVKKIVNDFKEKMLKQ
jgi:hypothetical protein